MDDDVGAADRPPSGQNREQPATVQAPARIYLPFPDEASQLDDHPAWSATRAGASDIEYVRADLAAASVASAAPRASSRAAPSVQDQAPGAGASLVARWCAGWGEERPSRAVQREMAEDIDHAVAAALQAKAAEMQARAAALEAKAAAAAAGPPRRVRAPRSTQATEQLALELTAPGPDGEVSGPGGERLGPASGQRPGPATRSDAGATPHARPDVDPHARGWVRSDAYLARLWSSANAEALAALAAHRGGLDVALRPEPTNEVDGEAVAIAVDLPEAIAGGFEAAWAPAMRVIGYIARAEARKDALFAALSGVDTAPRDARLHLEPDGWYVHIVRAAGRSGA